MTVTETVKPLQDRIDRKQHRAAYDASADFLFDRQFLKVGLHDDLFYLGIVSNQVACCSDAEDSNDLQ
jgi:hypothetical protein